MGDERRRRTRIEGQYDGLLIVGDMEYPVVTQNVSLKGILCRSAENIPLSDGAPCIIVLTLAPGAHPEMEARLIRQRDGILAVDFTGMDERSYSHLRNVVRYMSDDPDLIDSEQAFPAFSRDAPEEDIPEE